MVQRVTGDKYYDDEVLELLESRRQPDERPLGEALKELTCKVAGNSIFLRCPGSETCRLSYQGRTFIVQGDTPYAYVEDGSIVVNASGISFKTDNAEELASIIEGSTSVD